MYTIEIYDRELRAALDRLIVAGSDPRAAFEEIGDFLVETTTRRFDSSTGPLGERWPQNQPSTLTNYLGCYQGTRAKRGGLTKKGADRAAGKKYLIRETKSLSSTIAWQLVGDDALLVGSPMEYAAVQQFGAKRGAFGKTRRGAPIPWGDIPARPFLGISEDDKGAILAVFEGHLRAAVGG